MELFTKLKLLTDPNGASGDEFSASEAAAELLRRYTDNVEIDAFGDVIGLIPCGDENAPTLMLDAHLDQIGFLVTEITKDGFLRFVMVGGVDGRMLPGSELCVITRRHGVIRGIVGAVPPHLQKGAGKQTDAISMDDMTVDIGMTGEQARSVVSIGDYMCFSGSAMALQHDFVTSRSLDDRACFLCILHALELLKDKKLPVNLLICGSTKEELGGNGAQYVAERFKPEYAIAVDVTHAKTADAQDVRGELAKGPDVSIGFNSRPDFAEKVIETAKKHNIPYQTAACPGRSGTNAWSIQPAGVKTLVLSLPLKYMHSPVEVLRLCDVENTGALLAAVISELDWRADK